MARHFYDPVGAFGEPVPACGDKGGMDVYRAEISARFGFTFLGDCAPRPVRGGSSWSVHAVRRAIDFGYAENDRARCDRYLDWLTEDDGRRAKVLGVQGIHDYAIGADGSYGQNRADKRMWGHGEDRWRFGRVGPGWFWTHTELTVAAASSAPGMRDRFALVDGLRPEIPLTTFDLESDMPVYVRDAANIHRILERLPGGAYVDVDDQDVFDVLGIDPNNLPVKPIAHWLVVTRASRDLPPLN